MKRMFTLPSLIVLVLGCGQRSALSSSSLNESDHQSANVQATDGTSIRVSYDTTIDRTDFTKYAFATNISFTLDRFEAQTARIVLIETCTNGGRGVFQCDVHVDGDHLSARYPDNCFHDSNYDNNYYASFAPKFLISSEGHGMLRSECSQELAVFRGGVWLVDPINGTHNFKFKFVE